MKSLQQSFLVPFTYSVFFTEDIFEERNHILKGLINKSPDEKVLVIYDENVLCKSDNLLADTNQYFEKNLPGQLTEVMILPGGEAIKNETGRVNEILEAIERGKLSRHSYIIVVGGGALLDLAGYAASIAHRGIRLIRIPTTVLAQNDSGVGVKNSVNYFNKKNFLGCFAPPYAVINDRKFLMTLEQRDWIAGIAEAIKVSLIKDEEFFYFILSNASSLVAKDQDIMQELIYRCAELHMQHIGGDDPFERGSSRPLDFGHWAAHKLEQMDMYQIRHGEAVAVGIVLDVTISYLRNYISQKSWYQIFDCINQCGFKDIIATYLPFLITNYLELEKGLHEFREHLGGKLTIMLLAAIGKGIEVGTIEGEEILRSLKYANSYYPKNEISQL
ncbi:3-dehydroquinate synthase [Sporocytophaga myxococcoides]|uniref:3-dehydroquinate synthase n=1 Tax=Sporocytophaga myxococcoides TaxID=153721 RepID=A0A098L8U5_9BACT|nr:3-dehydroquinate synthase [Sporocytophaga myxococcoides]GAL83250.1 3-dehydroquinate synthase [Sporocytophaga myxococcoides]